MKDAMGSSLADCKKRVEDILTSLFGKGHQPGETVEGYRKAEGGEGDEKEEQD